jgi:hypothetical protein
MTKAGDTRSAARRRAEELLSRTTRADVERVETETKRRQAEDAKTERLRALRLAKEAVDKTQGGAASPRLLRSKR